MIRIVEDRHLFLYLAVQPYNTLFRASIILRMEYILL